MRWSPIRRFASVHAAVRDIIGGGGWDVSHELGQWHSVAGRAEELVVMAGAKSAHHIEIIDPTPTSCRFDAMYVR